MVIAAAGNVRPAKMERLVRHAFGGLKRGPVGNGRRTTPVPARSVFVKRQRRELEQMHLLMGLPAFPEGFGRRFPLYVLNTILGGTISSRLFQRIREERGLAYSVYSALNGFVDTGLLVVYAATGAESGREVVRLVQEELRDLRDRGPTEDELHVAREHLKGSLMLSLESTTSRMSNLARQEIYFRRQQGLADTLQSVDRVTRRQVHALAQEVIGNRRLGLAAVGRTPRLRIRAESLDL
jgi:predicted Zn-dependent peptidase